MTRQQQHHKQPSVSLSCFYAVLIFVTIITNVCSAVAPNDTSLSYYDDIRSDFLLDRSTTVEASNGSSNVFYIKDYDNRDFRLVDISCFLPFSNGTDERAFIREDVNNDAFAAMLATWNFNNPHHSHPLDVGRLIPKDCNVRLTTELFDTSFNPITSTRILTQILQRNHSLETPLPSAVVGAYRSATTSPLAILSGVNNVTQISYGSTSSDFDVTEQYPTFGRVCSSSVGDAQVAVDFFTQATNYSHVAVLFVTDAYGSALQKAFQDAAAEQGLLTESVAFSFSADPDGAEMKTAIQSLKNTQIRVFYAIAFEDHYKPIMTAALEEGIVGEDFLWYFPAFQLKTFQRNAAFEPNSPLAKATRGIGMVGFSGGNVLKPILPNANEGFPLEENPESSYEQFRVLWRRSVQDQQFVDYVRSRLPESLENVSGFDRTAPFSPEPGSFSPLVYDAIIALGVSMCGAQEDFFAGEEVYKIFSELDFEGASGNVLIKPDTGTRDHNTLTYTVWNVQDYEELDDDGRVQFKFVPTHSFSEEGWKEIEGSPYVYNDGTTTAPLGLPPVNMDMNLIGSVGQAVGYTLMAIVMFCSIVSFIWMVCYRDMAVVRQSQQLFLIMVSFGTFVMACTIIPLSLEEPVENLDAACMASPWVYLTGASIAFSALFAKTRGIYKAYKDPALDKILVTPFDFFITFVALFGVNFVILLAWTLVAPLEWDRVIDGSVDMFNRDTESYATCSNENALPFVITMLVVNMGILVVANFQSYKSRNIETEYNESRYIGISMAAFLQAWCMGIPILIVVWDQPQAKFYVQSGIIFVTALAVLLLIFVPKIRALRKEFKSAIEDSKLQSFRQHRIRFQNEEEYEDSETLAATAMAASAVAAAAAAVVAEEEERSNPAVASHWGLSIKEPSGGVTAAAAVAGEIKELPEDEAHSDFEEEKKMNSSEFKAPCDEGIHLNGNHDDVAQDHRHSADDTTRVAAQSLSMKVDGGGSFSRYLGRASSSSKKNRPIGGKKGSGRMSRFGLSGALKSDKPEAGGIRITHNPRSLRNLELSNGTELSRAQLEVIGQLAEDEGAGEQISKIPEEDETSRLEAAQR